MKAKMILSEVLEARGRSLYWLAKQLGADYTHLHRLKTGKAEGVTFDMLGRICTALECQPSDLLVLVDEKPESKKKLKSKV
jgi:putative transcriptional regulator